MPRSYYPIKDKKLKIKAYKNQNRCFPEYSESFLSGQDILYSQFYEVAFYVEDTAQDQLYLVLLQRIFPELKFEKVFPLGGKASVINKAKENINNPKKIYITDLDFDDISGNIVNLENLFYLQKYSIENHLIEMAAILEFIKINKKDYINLEEIELEDDLNEGLNLLSKLTTYFIINNLKKLNIKHFKLQISHNIDTSRKPFQFRGIKINEYFEAFEMQFYKGYPNECFDTLRINILSQYLSDKNSKLSKIPGKEILKYLDHVLRPLTKNSVNSKSILLSLAESISIEEFKFLKEPIDKFLNNVI